MKKLILPLVFSIVAISNTYAQELIFKEDQPVKNEKPAKKDWSKVSLGDRANDHFMFQVGYDGWGGLPDSLQTSGFGRHLNVYLMLDKPFQTDPRFSAGFGVGIGSSNIFFDKTKIDLKGSIRPNSATIYNSREENKFSKYKMTAVWAEVPVELRFISNPLKSDKSWKGSIGVKVGTMISGFTKGKNWETASGTSIYGNKYIEKEKDRKFLNSTRFAGTARIGYGIFTVYGAYQITALFKEGQGPEVRPYSIGLCISGL